MSTWFEATFTAILAALALPSVGLPAVFVWCTASATLLPMGSEPVVFAYIKLNPDLFIWGVLVATAGNTLGGMVNYWLAFGAKRVVSGTQSGPTARPIDPLSSSDKHTARALVWFEKLGPKALFFSFLPGIGDPLTAVAGWLKMPWWPCLYWQALGKLVRYVVMTGALLFIPDSWWARIFTPIVALFKSLYAALF